MSWRKSDTQSQEDEDETTTTRRQQIQELQRDQLKAPQKRERWRDKPQEIEEEHNARFLVLILPSCGRRTDAARIEGERSEKAMIKEFGDWKKKVRNERQSLKEE